MSTQTNGKVMAKALAKEKPIVKTMKIKELRYQICFSPENV